MHFDKALCVFSGFEPSHAPLPFACRLVRVLGPVIQLSMLLMSNAWHHNSFCSGIAAQLVGHNHARLTPGALQKLAKEPDGREPIPLRLNKDVENNSVLIDRSPYTASHPLISAQRDNAPRMLRVPLADMPHHSPEQFLIYS